MGCGGRAGERQNCKIYLISSILSMKNDRSCKNGGLKRVMFECFYMEQRLYFCYIFSYIFVQYEMGRTMRKNSDDVKYN